MCEVDMAAMLETSVWEEFFKSLQKNCWLHEMVSFVMIYFSIFGPITHFLSRNVAFLFDSPSRSFQLFSVRVPESEKRETTKERRGELVLASSIYQGIHVKRR